MNIETDIKKILLRFTKKREVATCTPPLAAPSRDWQLLLFAAAVLFLGSALWAGYTYFFVVQGGGEDVSLQPAVGKTRLLDEAGLSRILQLRDERARKRAEYLLEK